MHKLPQPVKLWYTGPMFRYEAPQSGRYRQHSQVGVEAIGSDDPAVDAELIDLLAHLYARLGLTGVRLHLTSIGDAGVARRSTRASCATTCCAATCSTPSSARGSRSTRCARSTGTRPRSRRSRRRRRRWSTGSRDADREHFDEVRRLLDGAGIDYELDPRLVRGLDYYTRTVFEFRSDALGAQSGIGGGGRYDRLIEQIGGDPDARGRLGDRPRADRAGDGGGRRGRGAARRRARRRAAASCSP